MRQDVRLGMAVGGLLVGSVLAYAIFSGPKNKGTDQAGELARGTSRDVAPAPGAGNDPAVTPEAGASNGAAAGGAGPSGEVPFSVPPRNADAGGDTSANGASNGANNGGSLGAALGGNTGDAGGSALRTGETGNTGIPGVPTDKWDWAEALNRGQGSALVHRGVTPKYEGSPIDLPGGPVDQRGPATRPANPIESGNVAPRAFDSGPKTYVVRAGETFWTIARDHYGNGGYWSHIARANPRISPKALKAGTVIDLPARSEVVPADASRALGTPVAKQIDSTREYRVKAGDSLTLICKALYGRTDPVSVGRLYEANRELIGPNQNALKQGMVLALPEPPTKIATAPLN